MNNIPHDVNQILDELVSIFHTNLNETLFGIYLHGSLVMNCFNPNSSDIDVLIIVSEKLTQCQKSEIMTKLIDLSYKSKNKIQLAVITKNSLHPLTLPCPTEFSFSGIPEDPNTIDEELSWDIAANLIIIKTRGITLYGEPIEDLPQPSDKLYLTSIAINADWSYNNIMRGPDIGTCKVPNYGVLNFCRVLAFIKVHLITSKVEGGEWGLKNLPEKYKPIIQEALNQYTKNSSQEVDCALLKEFAQYAQNIIIHAMI